MQQALVAIVLVALRRFRGSVLFPGPRPSSSQRVPSWLSGLTRQSSGPAKGGPLTLVVSHALKEDFMKKKSQGMHFFLTIFFGPLGLLYSKPGMVLPVLIGSFAIVAIAATAEMGGGAGLVILLGIYMAPLIIGFNAVENYNRSIDINELKSQEIGERRHRELLAAANSATNSQPASGTKACPYCAETILSTAIKCKHCGSNLAEI